ncbi:hypothetical protein TH60_13560 [Pantoea ananatis]|jgi:hypothetical protein|nr:hypothetical protein L585_05940 [Pantoea ananatis BRT175]MDC7870525.1 hypothetical protein [Pantoea ananatis]PKC47996.1 hypothetical protein V461_01705 [Pantoea ananatis BRT98]
MLARPALYFNVELALSYRATMINQTVDDCVFFQPVKGLTSEGAFSGIKLHKNKGRTMSGHRMIMR